MTTKVKPVAIHWWMSCFTPEMASQYEGTMDMEFESNRVKLNAVRIDAVDRTTIGGVPTEWLKEPEVREMLMADGKMQEIPAEWLVALDQTDDVDERRLFVKKD